MKLFWSKWKVARTIWPYPDGWGVYKENYLTGEKVIIDTGLPKESAEASAKQLNGEDGGTTDNSPHSHIGQGQGL